MKWKGPRQHSTINNNNNINCVCHGGSNGEVGAKSEQQDGWQAESASGTQTTMTIWQSQQIRSGRGGEVEKQVGSGEFRRGRWSGVSLALEMPKGSGMIGSIAKKRNR